MSESSETPRVQIIFEVREGRPVPRLPRGITGVLQPDGEKLLTPEQCAERFGGTSQKWRDEWISVWGPYLEPAPLGISVPAPAAALANTILVEDVVRVVRFPHLTDPQWNLVVSECRRRRIHPTEIWVKVRTNRETGAKEPIIITKIGVFRRIAQATGQRNGETAPEFCGSDCVWKKGPWPPNAGTPHAARAFVRRHGITEPFEGVAYFDQCAQYIRQPDGTSILDECWDKAGGAPQLGKCAIAAAYRAGWTEELGELYALEEFGATSPSDDRPSPLSASGELPTDQVVMTGVTAPVIEANLPDDPRCAVGLVDDSTPELSSLPLTLFYDGIGTMQDSRAFIDECSKLWPRILRNNTRAFAACVMNRYQSRKSRGAA